MFRVVKRCAALVAMSWALQVPGAAAAGDDTREMVQLPPMMQEHLLTSMRDHLSALNDILAALAEGNVDEATKVAEARLGMSSLPAHDAGHLAKFYPQGMQDFGTQMHHAASRFVIIARDAELSPGAESQHKVYEGLQAVTDACNGCHQSYRIR